MRHFSPNKQILLLALLLAVVTALTFMPVISHNFIRYDDRAYVTENSRVLGGLTWANVAWALRTGFASNWHPVTWLSHMLDVQLFGLRPGLHHLTSLILHAINTALVFLVLHLMTSAKWRSLAVAAFFGLHPLRVESVAWVAERKDVLSMLFLLLTLWAYTKYVHSERGSAGVNSAPGGKSLESRKWYLLALVCFALGLMCKPILVTLPFVLLLLDFWPLARFTFPVSCQTGLIIEKIPFFVLTAISSSITYYVQAQSHAVTTATPLLPRLDNAIASYWKYLGKTIWPANLAIYYPHPATRYPLSDQWPIWIIVLSGLALLLISIAAVWMFKRAPWVLVGWFWFLGTLVPVIGIVQVGGQALADRYTYLPSVGILILAIWSLASLVKASAAGGMIIKVVASIAILACMVQTETQLGYWKNNLTVFEHALAVTRNNSVAHTMVGIEKGQRGDFPAAISHFQQAIQTTPGDADGYFHLGYTYELLGKPDQALQQYLLALQLRPWDATFHYVFGKLLWSQGKKEETLQHFRKAVEINPDYFDALYALGAALDEMNASKDAIPYLKHAVSLRPKSREALLKFAEALMNAGRLSEAEMRFEQLVAMAPNNPENHINLGGILWVRGKWSEALLAYSQAVRLKPDWSVARYDLGTALMSQKRFEEAAQEFGEAARLNTNYAQAITGWGRALAAQGKTNEAVAKFEESLRIKADAFPLYQLAMVSLSQRKDSEAIDYLKRALELRPDWPIGLKELAWIRATASESNLRNGAEAIRLAERACQLTSKEDPACLNSLAAAYAETGKFDEAASTAEKALALTYRAGQPELAATLAEAVKLYRDHKPFRR